MAVRHHEFYKLAMCHSLNGDVIQTSSKHLPNLEEPERVIMSAEIRRNAVRRYGRSQATSFFLGFSSLMAF